jgi:hypothetical protein
MTTTTIKAKNLDASLVTFADKPKQSESGNGGKFVWVGYKNNKLAAQTPQMSIAFNLKPNDMGEYRKYSLELSFTDMENDKNLQKFHDNICEMDERIIDEGVKNSMAWFKQKTVSRDVVDAKYSKMIKTPTDKVTGDVLTQYPKRFRVKVPFYDEKFGCEVFNKKGEKMEGPLEEILVRGTRVKAIIECVGLWISASSYMCQWKVVRMEADVQKVQQGFAFLPDTDDEGDDDEDGEAKSSSAEVASASAEVANADSDEDSDADSDEDSDDEPAVETPVVETPAVETPAVETHIVESSDSDSEEEEEAPPPPPPVKKEKKEKKVKKAPKSKN